MATKNEPMQDKYVVLVGDPDTGTWSIACTTTSKMHATTAHSDLKADGTPSLLIYTGDYVTV